MMIDEQSTLACVHCGEQIAQDRFGVWYHPGTGATTCAPVDEPAPTEPPSPSPWASVVEAGDDEEEPFLRWWSRELRLPRWGYMVAAVLFLVAGIFVGKTT
jgi:hypothetical protein